MAQTDRNKKRSPADDWIPCKPGVLNSYKFESSLNSVSRRTALFQMAMIYGSGVFVAGASISSLLRNASGSLSQPARIACEEVKLHLCKYAARALPCKDLVASITHHLAECPICDCHYQKLIGNDRGLSHRSKCNPKKRDQLAETQTPQSDIPAEKQPDNRKVLP
jgi:hypothetical protein